MTDLMLFLNQHWVVILVSIICVFAGGYFSGAPQKRTSWLRCYLAAFAYEFPLSLMLILTGMGCVIGFWVGATQ